MTINDADPYVYFYKIDKKGPDGYSPAGYVSAASRSDAIEKPCKEHTVLEAQVSLEFELTKKEWDDDRARSWQGD